MTIPWDDWVTATIDQDGSRSIVAERPLRTLIVNSATRAPGEQLRIVLAFIGSKRAALPHRRRPDFPLARQLLIKKDGANRAQMEDPMA
jgi:hypothetical protein